MDADPGSVDIPQNLAVGCDFKAVHRIDVATHLAADNYLAGTHIPLDATRFKDDNAVITKDRPLNGTFYANRSLTGQFANHPGARSKNGYNFILIVDSGFSCI